ncbi:MAG: FecR family protein [Bacteroidota bacterium]
MSQNSENIEHLVYKFNNGSITPDELNVLINWYNSHDDTYAQIPTSKVETADELKARMLSGLLSRVAEAEPKVAKPFPLYKWMSAAAAVVLVTFATWMLVVNKKTSDIDTSAKAGIYPGGNKATLTLANGKTIELSSAQAGIITGDKITYANGQLVEDAELPAADQPIHSLALRTPLGGTYNITLPDGTEVWLNAGTTLKYPSRFAPAARIVYLEGEAYFHVKSIVQSNGEKLPFKVISNHQDVEVLGTQFNVNAYPEEATAKTTLVEGKVAVADKSERLILTPNHQAITTNGTTKIKAVDVHSFIAWREGKFSFDNKTFKETMTEISRWYDLRVVYQNGVPEEELVGDAFRNQNIDLVLRLLDVAEINYKLDVSQRLLTITGKKNRL